MKCGARITSVQISRISQRENTQVKQKSRSRTLPDAQKTPTMLPPISMSNSMVVLCGTPLYSPDFN